MSDPAAMNWMDDYVLAKERVDHLAESGLRYCLTHHGVVDADEDAPCDFARREPLEDDQPDCLLVPLLYDEPPMGAV